jgi:transposase-like protein
VYRVLSGASLARRICLCWVRRRRAWQLKTRPRVYECAACHRQESATAGTVFQRTRTDLTKWFLAAYLMGRDKRGVSAKFLQRELGVAYQTAWTMAHKLRHGLSEDPSCHPSR